MSMKRRMFICPCIETARFILSRGTVAVERVQMQDGAFQWIIGKVELIKNGVLLLCFLLHSSRQIMVYLAVSN